MHLSPKIRLLIAFLVLIFISVPVTIFILQKQQETRSKASGATTFSLIPQPGPSSSIQKSVGDVIPVDLVVDPGTNAVTIVSFQVQYDPNKLQPVTPDPVTIPTSVDPLKPFNTVVEGPIINNGLLSETISTGSNTAGALQTITKVATLHFRALAPTGETPTQLTFTNLSKAYSSASGDPAAINILSTTNPASITILPSSKTTVSFTLLLHGIGSAGDTVNPTGSSLSNKNPLHPQQNINVFVYNNSNQLVSTGSGVINFDNNTGDYKGQAALVPGVPTGSYTVKVKSDRYLRRLIRGVPTITSDQDNPMPVTELVAGDTNNDNRLDILDYNTLLDCGYGQINPLPMTNSNSKFAQSACQGHTTPAYADLEDNGIINIYDYNLFVRELHIQNGD